MFDQPDCYWHFTGWDIATPSKAARQKLAMYDRRVLLSAQEKDTVVLTSGSDPEALRFLHGLGVGPHPDHVVTDLKDVPKDRKVRPYTGAAKKQRELELHYGLTLNVPPYEVCRTANDKGFLQTLCGVDPICEEYVPKGYLVGPERPDGLARAVKAIHERGRPARIKVVNSASGIGQVVIPVGGEIVVPKVRDVEEAIVEEFVVQEEVEHTFDASVQFFITKNGTVNAETVTGQHIEDGHRHVGNFYPWDLFAPRRRRTVLAGKMQVATEAVVKHLVGELDYFGFGSVDFVGSIEEDASQDTVWALEVNARVTASFYPIMACRRWYKKVIPFDMRSFRVRRDVGWKQLKGAFRRILFDRATQYGFLPFCLLPQQGICHGVAFAPSTEKLLQLVGDVEERKRSLQ